jgi:hypothetical protein
MDRSGFFFRLEIEREEVACGKQEAAYLVRWWEVKAFVSSVRGETARDLRRFFFFWFMLLKCYLYEK